MARVIQRSVLAILVFSTLVAADKRDEPKNALLGTSYRAVVQTMRDSRMLDASNAVGAPAEHCHLLRPGTITTWLLRVKNSETQPMNVALSAETAADRGWTVELGQTSVSLAAGQEQYVKLSLHADPSLPPGTGAKVIVHAESDSGKNENVTLAAETWARRKIYYISIDSLGPEYLKLNAQGTGPGKPGDWLMPNLHAFLGRAVFYPDHTAHLPAATDMNHASYLSGAYPGRLGLYSVQVYMFGFEPKGWAIWRSTPLDLMYYGPDRKPVTTVFNVIKDPEAGGNPKAFTAYVSGKDWIPEHYRNPVFGLDRIVTVTDRPDFSPPATHGTTPGGAIKNMLTARIHKLNKPDFALWEDVFTADQAIAEIENEDPDASYILLGGVDEAGHMFGSAADPSEFDERGTPANLNDDVSRINRSANRVGMLNTVKGADAQLGRLLRFLEDRGQFDEAYLVVESDHDMETNSFVGPKIQNIAPLSGFNKRNDYYMFTGSQLGEVFLRRSDPAIAAAVARSLEDYRWKNPMTGESECPVIVLDHEEMKTGIDTATGQRVTAPGELYSEYYAEHPQPGQLRWPDLFLFPKAHLQFPSIGAGFGNIGLGVLPFDIPPFTVYVGGHGAPSTQHATLAIKGPGIPEGVVEHAETHPSDVAPTLYMLEGFKTPASVQGKILPGID